jgi:hypothetical protein
VTFGRTASRIFRTTVLGLVENWFEELRQRLGN